MKVSKKLHLREVFTLVITTLFVAYLYRNHRQLIDSLKNIKPQYLLLVLLGQSIGQYSNSAIFRDSLKPLGVMISSFESFRVVIVSSFVNFFTPVVGGASTRAVYMKAKHNLPYTAMISTLYAYYAIMFSVSFGFGLAGVLALPGAISSPVGVVVALFFGGGLLGGLAFIVVGHKLLKLISRIPIKSNLVKSVMTKVALVDDGWGSIRHEKKIVARMVLWSLIANGSLLLIYWSSLASIGQRVHLGTYMLFAALASVNLLLNLTPGNIGVRESLYASVYKLTGIGLQGVVAFSLVDRVGQIIVISLGWIFFGHSIVGKSKNRAKAIGDMHSRATENGSRRPKAYKD